MSPAKQYCFLLLLVAIVGLSGASLFVLTHLPGQNKTLGSATPPYGTATNSSVSCPSTTSTIVVVQSGARVSFTATNDSANAIYLCKAATCVVNTGMRLNATGGFFEQDDAYTGAYSCIASTGASTLNTSYNQ